MTRVKFSFGALEQSLAVGFRIPPDDFPKFRARIKQLQRLGFPDGVNIGRGAKMPYSTEHLLKLGTAFALLDTGLTAKLVTERVEGDWEKLAAGYWAARGTPRHSSDVFALFHSNALGSSREPDAVTIDDEFSKLNFEGAVENGLAPTCYIVLNITRLMRRLLSSADKAAQLANDFMELEIMGWRKKAPDFHPIGPGPDWYRIGQFDEDGVIKI